MSRVDACVNVLPVFVVQYNINTVTIVMNNSSWGAEKSYQRDFYGKRYIGVDIDSLTEEQTLYLKSWEEGT